MIGYVRNKLHAVQKARAIAISSCDCSKSRKCPECILKLRKNRRNLRSSRLDPRVIVILSVNTSLWRAIDKESNKTSTVLNIVKGLCWFENPVVLFLQEKLILPNVLQYKICIQNRNEDNSQPAECLFESCSVACWLFQLSAVSSSCRLRWWKSLGWA